MASSASELYEPLNSTAGDTRRVRTYGGVDVVESSDREVRVAVNRRVRTKTRSGSFDGLIAEQTAPEVPPTSEEDLNRFWNERMDNGGEIERVVERDQADVRGKLNWRSFQRLWRIAKLCYLESPCCCGVGSVCCYSLTLPTIAAAVLSMVAVLEQLLFFIFANAVIKDLGKGDRSGVINNLLMMIVCAVVLAPISGGLYNYVGSWLAIKNREYLTRHLHFRYTQPSVMYRLLTMDKRIDNPDQRITLDAAEFAAGWNTVWWPYTGDGANGLLQSLVSVVVFGFICVKNVGYPAVIAAVVWAVFGNALVKLCLNRVVALEFRQDRLEGDFRFEHIHTRDNAESIVFYGGQATEHASLNSSLARVLTNLRSVAAYYVPLDFAGNLIDNVSGTVSILIPLILMSVGQLPAVTQAKTNAEAAAAFVQIFSYTSGFIGAVSNLPFLLGTVSVLLNSANRVGEFLEVLDDIEAQCEESIYQYASTDDFVTVGNTTYEDGVVGLESVTVSTPDNCVLVRDLTLSVRKGQSLLILGPSGVGKSSLLRVLGGLWPLGYNGKLTRPAAVGRGGVFSLPQRTYIPLAGVKAMIVYPLEYSEGMLSDTEARELLTFVGLDHLFEYEEEIEDWSEWDAKLSGGEKQRVAMARLFYHKPAFAFVDECTSAVSVEMEDRFYERCAELDISLVSVSHNTRVAAYHTHMLVLTGEGRYHVLPADADRAEKFAMNGYRTVERETMDTKLPFSTPEVDVSGDVVSAPHTVAGYYTPYHPQSEGDGASEHLLAETCEARKDVAARGVDARAVAGFWEERSKREWLADVEGRDLVDKRSDLDGRFVHRLWRVYGLATDGYKLTNVCSLPIIGATLCSICVGVAAAYVPIVQTKVTSAATASPLHHTLLLLVVLFSVFAAASLAVALSYYCRRLNYIAWRGRITRHLHFRYTLGRTLYSVNAIDGRVDNPDQRIQQDAQFFALLLSEIVWSSNNINGLVITVVAVVTSMVANYAAITQWGIVLAFGYYVVVLLGTLLFSRPLVPLVFRQDRFEGDFRFAHVRARTFVESIAFFGGSAKEHSLLNTNLARALANSKFVIFREFFLNTFVVFTNILNTIVGFGFPAYLVLTLGAHSLGYDNASDAFLGVYLAYSTLSGNLLASLELAEPLAEFAGHTNRLGQFLEVLDDLAEQTFADGEVVHMDGVALDNVTVLAPTGRVLVRNLTVAVTAGHCLFIEGPSGCGKSSILRVIGGLYTSAPGSGPVSRPHTVGRGGILFLPQSPYLVLGTLKEQVMYPATPDTDVLSDGDLRRMLVSVKLGHLYDKVYATADDPEVINAERWEDLLSGGEKQRLAMCRVYYHRPSIVILDESTSACDAGIEREFYTQLRERGIVYVSVSHRPHVRNYHDDVLRVKDGGEYEIVPVKV